MKNLSILIFERFFLDLAFLREVKQSIGQNISFFLTIMDLKVVSRKFLGPINLVKVQTFCIYKLTNVIIVDKDKNLVFATFQLVAPSLESFNNSHKFLIMGFI